MSHEPTTDLLGHSELTTSEGPRPGHGIAGTVISRSFRFEQTQHPLRAVGGPRRDDPPISFAQRLRRTHAPILPASFQRSGSRCPAQGSLGYRLSTPV